MIRQCQRFQTNMMIIENESFWTRIKNNPVVNKIEFTLFYKINEKIVGCYIQLKLS